MSGTRYTGTDLTGALGEDPIKDPNKAMKATQKALKINIIKHSLIHMVLQILTL